MPKITALPAAASVTPDDLVAIVNDPGGTPETQKATVTQVRAAIVPVAIASEVSGLGANVAALLATFSSANLAAALTDETGSGAAVFANTPTLVTPNIGAATGTSLALSSFMSAGGGVPNSATTIRLPSAATIGWRTSGGGDRTLVSFNASDQFILGTTNEQTTVNGFFVTLASGGSDVLITCGGVERVRFLNTAPGFWIWDSDNSHTYTITPSNLAGNRSITLPLLTGNDTMVCEAHTQTLANKTLTSPILNTPTLNTATIQGSPTTIGSTSVQATGNARCKTYTDVANVQTTDATVTTVFSYTATDECTTLNTAEILACRSTGAETAAYVRRCRIKRDGGTVTVGTVEDSYTSEETAAWDATTDSSGSTIRDRVTGEAGKTIDWGAVNTRIEVTHA